jgi:hypothetical protein
MFTPPIMTNRPMLGTYDEEKSVQIQKRKHFPVTKLRPKHAKNPHKRAKYNKFYRTQNFKGKKKLNLFDQLENSQAGRQIFASHHTSRNNNAHPLDLIN